MVLSHSRMASGWPRISGASAVRGMPTVSVNANSLRMSYKVSRSPRSVSDTSDCDHPSIRLPSFSCESPDAVRKIATTAGISTRASTSRIGRESHSHVRTIPAESRDARAHAAHSGSELYRDSTATRRPGRSARPQASDSSPRSSHRGHPTRPLCAEYGNGVTLARATLWLFRSVIATCWPAMPRRQQVISSCGHRLAERGVDLVRAGRLG